MSRKKYIVTGGSGFIGSHIVDILVENNSTVIVIDNNSNGLEPIINKKASYHNIDISDISKMNELKKILYKADGIFHCAALINVQDSINEPYKYEANNTLGTLNILQAAVKSKVKKIVYSSSAAVYGNQEIGSISENAEINPISPYGNQKYYGEIICKMFSNLYDIETCCLRYFNAFGERQKISGSYATVIGIFKYQISKKLPLTITGDGEQRRDFIYVKDLSKANISAMVSKKKFLGDVFNIGSGESFSINEIAEFFQAPKKYIPAVKEPKESLADINKAKKILNWNPSTDVKKWIISNL
tara:strand:+ start:7370 stop:8272 length:903 start_codon:yes stop_codon:yes gene_type:complete